MSCKVKSRLIFCVKLTLNISLKPLNPCLLMQTVQGKVTSIKENRFSLNNQFFYIVGE